MLNLERLTKKRFNEIYKQIRFILLLIVLCVLVFYSYTLINHRPYHYLTYLLIVLYLVTTVITAFCIDYYFYTVKQAFDSPNPDIYKVRIQDVRDAKVIYRCWVGLLFLLSIPVVFYT